MTFNELANTFEKTEIEQSRTKITILLAQLFKTTTPEEAQIISYLSLGSLYPVYKGTQFNFAEKSVQKVLALLLDCTLAHIKSQADKLGDLGSVVGAGGWEQASKENIKVTKVYKQLEEFLNITGIGSQESKEKKLIEILKSLDLLSAKYVIRIILGKLRMGFSDMTLLDAFSWMEKGDKSIREELENAYNISADIGLIIKILKQDGLLALKHIKITPGIPIRPAAAERMASAKDIFEKLGLCVAQPKLDGFRIQVHLDKRKKSPEVSFFSRNLLNMSDMFPDLKKSVVSLDVETFVAEGEAIAYDIETGSFLPFQETVKRKRKYDIEKVSQDYPLKLYFFDLLYLDNKSYIDFSHTVRREKLKEILDKKIIKEEKVLFLTEEIKISDVKTLEEYFMSSISSGLEGVVVKRPDALYQAGKRNFNWIKLKRKESGELEDTIDCVILGYYAGRGKRATFGIGAFLVGVYNEQKECFQTVAKIGTGLTDTEWKELKKSCDESSTINKPKEVECTKELFPDVWVFPTIVCIVRADEITRSPFHTAGRTEKSSGIALRFPRIMGYRPDKGPQEATTVKEIMRLFQLQFEKQK
jgi:DNA ligase-1